MFNIDGTQGRIIRQAFGTAIAFWLFSQIADASLFERLWHQAAILALGYGAIRVWILGSAKTDARRSNQSGRG